MIRLSLLLVLLLTGQCFSQCFTEINCSGIVIPAANVKECCVQTEDGHSFSDGGTCTLCIVHGFSRAVYEVIEDDRLDASFQMNVKGETNFGSVVVIRGVITSEAGTADTSDFEKVHPINVSIGVGSTAAEIFVYTKADFVSLEYDDSVILRFTSDIPELIPGLEGVGEYIRESTIVNIIDQDLLLINFEACDYSVKEGSDLMRPIRLQLNGQRENSLTLTLSPVSIDTAEDMGLGLFINSEIIDQEGYRATSGIDFTNLTHIITIPASDFFGMQTFELPEFFSVIDDDIDEFEQSFALVAEIGSDVRTNIVCFQTRVRENNCYGRRGATEIKIRDNDLMVIGFTQRSRSVSEGDAPPGEDYNRLTIAVATQRTSERAHTIIFRFLEHRSTAIVESPFIQHDPFFDALFGSRNMEERHHLDPGESTISPIITLIRNDFRPELEECYTIGIYPTDIAGVRELFTCNDGDGVTDFFCEHTICIENDDAPFVVAFVETTYTVVEGEGPVEVCVNLTQPQVDILDENVRVYITSDANSVYIPPGARQATPDEPDFLSRYSMADGTDYAEQTFGVNLIDDELITAVTRIVCYNQTIYDDVYLESSEYIGLTLGVRQATIETNVQPMYNQSAILILDDGDRVPQSDGDQLRSQTGQRQGRGGQGFTQCYTDTGCIGSTTPAANARDCCVRTDNGLAFSDGSTCIVCIVHGFLRAVYTVMEGERLDTMFRLNVKGQTVLATLFISGIIREEGGATAESIDYEVLGDITVQNSAAQVRLYTRDDVVGLEYDDTVILRFIPEIPQLSAGLESVGEYLRDSATVNIIDNDRLEISFLDCDYSSIEGSGLTRPILVQFYGPTENPFTLRLRSVSINSAEAMGLSHFLDLESTINDTRATAGTDFSERSFVVTVPQSGNNDIQAFQLPEFFSVIDDDIDEIEQNFALVAEIGSDVPTNIACFQVFLGDTDCFGRRGATDIQITDNDFMVIGFTQRSQTVSEGDAQPSADFFSVSIPVTSQSPTEREHQIIFRHLKNRGTAIVQNQAFPRDPLFDVLFGNEDVDPIEIRHILLPGHNTIPSLITRVRNDLRVESQECFTIGIYPIEIAGARELFTCNDGDDATNFFCDHTICIDDDDEIFVVAFLQTTYTVVESKGQVEVCVNLIRPENDILDETVRVYVANNESSIYIPPGARRATPDRPDFLSRYFMVHGSDYTEQTISVNLIDNELITEEMRIVCYNQTIYNDIRLEVSEYAGLTLGVRQATLLTEVQPLHNFASIQILDDDMAVVGLERTFYSVTEDVGVVELCVIVTEPNIQCPIEFPFNVSLSNADRTAVSPMDFEEIDMILTFATCDTRQCVSVTIMDDSADESVETFGYNIERTPGLDPRITLDPAIGEVVILDDDGFDQCYTDTGCGGKAIPASNRRECCVESDDGHSFSNSGTCTTCIVHGFSKAVYDIIEEERLDTFFQLNVKGQTIFGTALTIMGIVIAEADSAERSDFEKVCHPISIPDEMQNSTKIRLFASRDFVSLEHDDTVILRFTPNIPYLIPALEAEGEYIRDSAIVNIIDRNKMEINFEACDYSAREDSGLTRPIRMQLTGQRESPFTLTLKPVSIDTAEDMGLGIYINSAMNSLDSRATPGVDFTNMTLTVTVPASDVVGTETIELPEFFSIVDDDINENDQSFALIAEIGQDVPANTACFLTQTRERDCHGRVGATGIIIRDNDPMIIGFTQRSQTVSEGSGALDTFLLTIPVVTERISEREHTIVVQYQESSSTAIVEPLNKQNDPFYDALFGNRDSIGDPLVFFLGLSPGDDSILPVITIIRNDFRVEAQECYTIRIFSTDIIGYRRSFHCNDGADATSYFCDHTVCIDNDDETFVVAFVQTTYTVVEGEGPVEVCVNLTRPEIDILDESVSVYVINDPNSIYIPTGARQATPDEPDFLGRYPMLDGTDYQEQTTGANLIDDKQITAVTRIVCYNQTIYDDTYFEPSEYIGLTLGVRQATVRTMVKPMYDQATILILDDGDRGQQPSDGSQPRSDGNQQRSEVRQGFSQCYTDTGCRGRTVPAANARECCIGSNDGLSYSDFGRCTICVVHGFQKTVYDVMEGDRLDTTFQLNVKGQTQFGSALVISGMITSEEGTTAGVSDFEALGPINVVNSAADIRLHAYSDDVTLEYTDRVILRFTSDITGLISGLEGEGEYVRESATVNIIDTNRLEVSFEECDYSSIEGSGLTRPIRVLFYGPTENSFTLRLSTVSITTADAIGLNIFLGSVTNDSSFRATAGDDFTGRNFTVTVPAVSNNDMQTFQLPEFYRVIDDDINELEQSFVVVAEIGPDVPMTTACFQTQLGERNCFGRRGARVVKIVDNDAMVIGFTSRAQTVSEGDAQDGVDHFQLTIDIASQRISERYHRLVFRYQESNSTAVVETLRFRDPFYDAIFGTRETDSDDDPIEVIGELVPGEATVTSLITSVRNDLRVEPRECYTISISTYYVEDARELFTCNDEDDATNYFCEHTICIEDDDELFKVAFVQTTYTVVESEGPVEVCVNLTRPANDILDETVRVYVINNKSSIYIPPGAKRATPDEPDFLSRYFMVDGTDYAEQTISVNLIDDEIITEVTRIVCYSQTIYDDLRLEVSEYAGLSLGVDMATIRTIVQPLYNFAAIQILDNDMAVVGLELTFYSVSEDVGVVEVCAIVRSPEIRCPIEFPFNISLSTRDRTAGSPMDYQSLSMVLIFAACDIRQCVNVRIIDDSVTEQEEVLDYILERTPGLDPRITISPQGGEIVITEDESDSDVLISVGYQTTVYTVSEGQGAINLSIMIFDPLPGGAPRPFSLSISTDDGTAASPSDYASVTSQIIQFTTAQTSALHSITINQDEMCEEDPNEDLFSSIALVSGTQGINIIHPRAQVIIDDTNEADCNRITVGYEQTAYTTYEGLRQVTLCTVILDPPTGGATRDFFLLASTSDGSAVSREDYETAFDVRLDYTVGQMTSCHVITVTDDDYCENYTSQFFLSNLVLGGGENILIDPSQAQVVIHDANETECVPIAVGYEFGSYTTSETLGVLDMCIVIYSPADGIAPHDLEVYSTTHDETSEENADFLNGTVILNFSRGSQRVCHRITIIQDDECELTDEIFVGELTLSKAVQVGHSNIFTRVHIDDSKEPECELPCTARGITEVVIDCDNIGSDITTQCSFERRPQHLCSLPLTLNSDVSPVGNHSVRIIANTGREATVSYIIITATSTVSAKVPPLGVFFINGSPRVAATSVVAEFEITRTVAGVRCYLRSQNDRIWQNCSSGRVVFTDLQPGLYVLKVHAYNRRADVGTVKRGFVVTSDPTYCSLVLVNRGVTLSEDGTSAVVEFQLYGPATQLLCSLDGGNPYSCASPVELSMLAAGHHKLVISPRGCTGGSKTLSVPFTT